MDTCEYVWDTPTHIHMFPFKPFNFTLCCYMPFGHITTQGSCFINTQTRVNCVVYNLYNLYNLHKSHVFIYINGHMRICVGYAHTYSHVSI